MLSSTLTLVVTLMCSVSVRARSSEYTPLLNDMMPCVAENVKETDHYICTEDHEMICLSGWTDISKQCRTPICKFHTSDDTFKSCHENHGECVRPNVCACEVGWEGVACDKCIAMPGCLHGHCADEAFGCICHNEEEYTGALCDVPVCKEGCLHGSCKEPGQCICEQGWTGELCNECITLPGCKHGTCGENPLECVCLEGWMGPLCDCPICSEGCSMEHGYCTGDDESSLHECLCQPGWRGANCTECIPYPGCPGTCNEPWECICPEGVTGEHCGRTVKKNCLPKYYHHEMNQACCQMNNERNGVTSGSASSGSGEDSKSPFSWELVHGKPSNISEASK